MAPQRLVGILLLAAGIVLLIMGIRAADSLGSQFSELFTGNPSDRSIWLTIGGILGILAGATLAIIPVKGART